MVTCRLHRPAAAGFSLIELMIAIAIVGVLALMAMPGLNGYVAGQRIRAASFEIISALQYARSEAIKRNTEVSVEAKDESWGNGWRIVVDGTTLLDHEPLKGVTVGGLRDGDDNALVTYNRSGRFTTAIENGEIASSNPDYADMSRCILVDATGMPRSTMKTGGSC